MRNRLTYFLIIMMGCSSLIAQDTLRKEDAKSVNASQVTQVLTLADCQRIALEKATLVLKTNNALKLTGSQLLYAYGQFLPDLTFGANYTYNGGKNLFVTAGISHIDMKQNLLNYQLLTTINIFNGLNDYSQLKSFTANKSAATFNLDRARQQISFDIAQAYYQVILDRRIVEYGRENLNASLQREQQLSELARVGRKAMVDFYQQEALTSSDSLFYIQSQTHAKNDLIQLLRRMQVTQTGADKYDIVDIPDNTQEKSLVVEDQTADNLINDGLDNRPDLKAYEQNIKSSEYTIKQYRSGYLPKLNLFAGLVSNGGYLDQMSVNGADVLATNQQQELGKALFGQVYGTVGLNLSWKLFDKLYTKTSVDMARVYLDNAHIDHDDLVVQVASDIKQARNDFFDALAQISTSGKGLYAATQAYDAVKGRYDLGAANFVELSNAQAVLLQAKVNKAQADIKLLLQNRVVHYLVGK